MVQRVVYRLKMVRQRLIGLDGVRRMRASFFIVGLQGDEVGGYWHCHILVGNFASLDLGRMPQKSCVAHQRALIGASFPDTQQRGAAFVKVLVLCGQSLAPTRMAQVLGLSVSVGGSLHSSPFGLLGLQQCFDGDIKPGG